jgi:hypothetical protein
VRVVLAVSGREMAYTPASRHLKQVIRFLTVAFLHLTIAILIVSNHYKLIKNVLRAFHEVRSLTLQLEVIDSAISATSPAKASPPLAGPSTPNATSEPTPSSPNARDSAKLVSLAYFRVRLAFYSASSS